MYPSTTLFVALGQFAIVVLVLFSYPLQVHPCRNCLDKVFTSTDPAAGKVVTTADDEEDDDDDTTIEEELLRGGAVDMSPVKHTLLTSSIVAFGFLIAYVVDDLRLGECLLPTSCLSSCADNIKSYHSSGLRGLPPYHSFCPAYSTSR